MRIKPTIKKSKNSKKKKVTQAVFSNLPLPRLNYKTFLIVYIEEKKTFKIFVSSSKIIRYGGHRMF